MIFKRLFFVILMTLAIITVISCATTGQNIYHGKIMKGSIVDISDSDVYLCIGIKDGAAVGQELNVYRIVSRLTVSKARQFERERIGKVKILEIIDEHFAKAKVVSGTAAKNDIVELESR